MNKPSSRPLPFTLQARHVVPICGDPIDNGWVQIVRGRVVALGSRRPPGPVRDLGDVIILPGLVNAHTHLEFSDLDRPLPAIGGLPAWIERVVAMRRSRVASGADETSRLVAAVQSGFDQSAVAGVTAIGEIATASHPQTSATGPLVRVFREMIGLSPAATAAARAILRRELDHLSHAGVLAGLSPHAPYSVTESLGRQMLREVVCRRLPVAMHLAESRDEAELLATGGGAFRSLLVQLGAWQPESPPRLLPLADWITLLARAPRGIVVHGTFLPEDQTALSRLAWHRDRLCVAVCPRTTLAISGVLPPVESFRTAGIRVAIGTDSRASNPDLSVLAECRTLVEGGVCSPAESLAMATLDGAWALAFERRCGSLARGRVADLAILRPTARYGDPYEGVLDPATHVVTTLRRGKVIAGLLA